MDDSSSYQKEIDILKELIVAINLIRSIVLRHTKKTTFMKIFFDNFYNMDYFSSDHEEVERKLFCNRSGFVFLLSFRQMVMKFLILVTKSLSIV